MHPARAADDSELWARLSGVARIFFLRHAPGPDGEDLVHEALTALLEARRSGRLRASETEGAFLLGVCRNLVSRRARNDARTERARLKLVDEVTAPPRESGVDLRRLWECFNRLTARSRQVLEKSFVAEESAAEIGALLRMAEGNVRVVRHRALASLKTCVEGGGPEELT